MSFCVHATCVPVVVASLLPRVTCQGLIGGGRMADVDVVLRCFEDGWHYRCDRPLRNEMKVVESVEDSFQSNDELRSNQANASGTEAAGSLGEESTAKNSAVVPGDW